MIQQSDSTSVTESTPEAPATTGAQHHAGYHSPAEIIGWLPASASPEQQDSMLRSHYKYQEVDWSTYPNPLCTPTTKADPKQVFTPGKPYLAHSIVQPDSLYNPIVLAHRPGVAGDAVPYSIAGDDLITSILLFCFIFATVALGRTGGFIRRQLKNFFYPQREGTTVITETSSELRFQFFLILQTCLLFSLMFFFWSGAFERESFAITHYEIISLYTGIFIIYFLLKAILYWTIGWVFIGKKKNEQWMKAGLFLVSSEGILLFPAVMLVAYFDLSLESVVLYTIFVVILIKILSFYKMHLIFFRKDGNILQSFLYFCALEMMPLGAMWGVLVLVDNYLKLNF